MLLLPLPEAPSPGGATRWLHIWRTIRNPVVAHEESFTRGRDLGAGGEENDDVRLILNVVWLIFGGLWLALGYAVAGVILCILIITIPFGIAAFRMANFTLWPFGRRLADKPDAGAGSLVGNIVWLVLAGWWLALAHIAT